MLAQEVRITVADKLVRLGIDVTPESAEVTFTFVGFSLILATLSYWSAHRIVLSVSERLHAQNMQTVGYHIDQHRLPYRLAILLPLLILDLLVPLALSHYPWLAMVMERVLGVVLLVAFITLLFSVLDTFNDLAKARGVTKRMPVKSFVQLTKLFMIFIGIVVSVSILSNESPLIFLSSLGVATGFVMLVFKDTILGFVAGIQLSANNMVSLNDWIQLDSYGANGSVEEISLTTVKVRNFDNTISMLPAYALVQNAFINWQGMSDSGGRRIKRAINIDVTSVKFLTHEELEKLKTIHVLRVYLEKKRQEINEYNDKFDESQKEGNTRNITNVGLFRAYIKFYLLAHKGINQDMLIMARQLDPTPQGLPLQIYAFTSSTEWEVYENIQSDIFDHLYSIMPLFGLRAFQNLTGNDVTRMNQH